MTSMSDSLIAFQPRMEEPSKPRPSSKTPSSRASAGMVKCCHKPGKSMKRRSTARTSRSRIRARTSFGVTNEDLQRSCETNQNLSSRRRYARRHLLVSDLATNANMQHHDNNLGLVNAKALSE